MFAAIAAVIFGLGILLDLGKVDLGDRISMTTVILCGLLALAIHMTGAITGRATGRRR